MDAAQAANVAVYFVWIPMLPGDSEEEARRFAASLGTSRARHFYDAARRAGIVYAEDYFHEVMQEAFVTAPDDSSYRARLIRQLNAPPRDHPVWDAVLMFQPGVEWGARAPRPDWWARQVGFFGTDSPERQTGLIWKKPGTQAPLKTDWFVELREALRLMTSGRESLPK